MHPPITDSSFSHCTKPALASTAYHHIQAAIASLPPCPKDHVRLYRATIVSSEAIKKLYADAEKKMSEGSFAIDSQRNKDIFNRIIENKHKLIGRFYSDSLKATLPYFLRHNDDPEAARVLCYVDVPVQTAQKYYFANVASVQIGAVHRQKTFDRLYKKARALVDSALQTINNSTDLLQALGRKKRKKQKKYLSEIDKANEILKTGKETLMDLNKRQDDFDEFLRAYTTCKFADIDDEFFLPLDFIEKNKKDVVTVDWHEQKTLSESDWAAIGEALDAGDPNRAISLDQLRDYPTEAALKEIFGASYAAESNARKTKGK